MQTNKNEELETDERWLCQVCDGLFETQKFLHKHADKEHDGYIFPPELLKNLHTDHVHTHPGNYRL